MIPNIAQSIQDLLKTASPEQKIIWQQIRLITGENAAVQQINYSGLISGSMFATYDSHILYLGLLIYVGFSGNPVNTNFYISFYDETNTLCLSGSNSDTYWNTVVPEAQRIGNLIEIKNMFFGRVTNAGYNLIKIIGFRFDY